MAFVIIEMWGELIGEPETGAWCAVCALPSGVIYQVATGVGDHVLTACRHFACADCGQHLHLANVMASELNGSPHEPTYEERCVTGI